MRILLILFILVIGKLGLAQVVQDSVQHDSTVAKVPSQPKQATTRKDTRPFIKRIGFGGSTAFWWSIHQVHVEVSPTMAYHFPKILTTGVGYRYIFVRDLLYHKNLNTYGPNIFARAQLTKRIYLWSEWENLRTEYVSKNDDTQEERVKSEYVDSFFAGAGYIMHLGKRGRGGLSFQLLYNFLYNREDNSPYYSPVIYRVGYFF